MIRVNDKTLDEEMIHKEMQYHTAGSQREAMIKAGESLIIAELIKQRAAELGIETDGREEEEYLQQLIDKDVQIPSASAQECQTYYQQNLEKFNSSPLLAVKHILLAADPEDPAARMEAEDLAKQLIGQLQQDASLFAGLAQAHSACPSKETGGQLGQISKGQTVPEFERQIFACQPGLVEVPIASRYGFHVALVEHREEGRQLPYEAVAERIADYLNEKVKRKSIAQYIQTLISNAEIEGYDFGVSSSPLMQ